MSKIAFLLTLLVTVFVGLLPAAPAQALAGRTFLSAAGSDSNNCTSVLTPCRHLATAFAATAPDGEIYVLDPANYGSLTITHAVSIEGHGWASIAPTSGNPAITINASTGDKINIIGVVLDGTALAGTTGIQFNSGGSLIVRDSVIRNFSGDGIFFTPNSLSLTQLFVSNTLISDNNTGIDIGPTGSAAQTTNGVLNHVEIENNASHGLLVDPVGVTVNLTVSDSVSANNAADGIHVVTNGGAVISVMVRNSTIANNAADGLQAIGSATIRVTRSTITGNVTGWANTASGVVLSYGDNNIDGNTNANTEPPNPLVYH
jgi:Right handed beta helix region